MISEEQVELIEALCSHYKEKPGSEVEVMKAIDFVLFDARKLLEATIETLGDDGNSYAVKEIRSTSCSRKFWKVRGSHDKEYTCLQAFCSCPSFLMQARQVKGTAMCKHMLAVKVAGMMGSIEHEDVTDERFVELMCLETSTTGVVSARPFRTWKK